MNKEAIAVTNRTWVALAVVGFMLVAQWAGALGIIYIVTYLLGLGPFTLNVVVSLMLAMWGVGVAARVVKALTDGAGGLLLSLCACAANVWLVKSFLTVGWDIALLAWGMMLGVCVVLMVLHCAVIAAWRATQQTPRMAGEPLHGSSWRA
jgi:hypothetical protein